MAARSHVDTDFDVTIEFAKYRYHAVEGEAVELRVSDTREIGMRNAGQLFRGPRAKLAVIEHTDDPRREDGARLLKIGVGATKIAEHIAASAHQFKIVLAHRSASFSRLILSLMRSMSICGVLIPLFDFF
jgi:hypothetical protein